MALNKEVIKGCLMDLIYKTKSFCFGIKGHSVKHQ